MPFVPAADTVRLAINYLSITGEEATNVLHFRNTGDPVNATTINQLLTAVESWLTNHWAGVASEDWQTDVLVATDISVQEGLQISRLTVINGTIASRSLPAADTIAVSFRSGFTGRSRRGRAYHAGLAEDMVVGSRITLTFAASIPAAWFELIDIVSNVGWDWVVASFISNKAPRVTALLTPINDVILTDSVVDSMDTRKPRGA